MKKKNCVWTMSLCLWLASVAWGSNPYVTQDTIAYWEFSDAPPGTVTAGGQRIHDISGNNHDLVVLAATDGTTPVFSDAGPYSKTTGSAMQFFTQKGDKLAFIPGYQFNDGGPNASTSPIAFDYTDEWTIEFAVRMPKSNTGFHSPFHMYEEGLYPFFWTRFENAGFRWLARIVSGGGTTGSTVGSNMFDGQWHHLAMTRNTTTSEIGKEITVYIDYQKIYEGPDNTGVTWPFNRFFIGGWGSQNDRDLIGCLAFVRVTGDDLAPQEFIQRDPVGATNPSPANNSLWMPTSLNLSWTQMQDVSIDFHTVIVSMDSEFNNVVNIFNNVQGNTVMLTDLDTSIKYYWRVDTQGSKDGVSFFQEGSVWTFSTLETNSTIAGHWTFEEGIPGETLSEGAQIVE